MNIPEVHIFKLLPTFRFSHEPYNGITNGSPFGFAGRDREIDTLAGRLLLSEGGAFLVAGYRGVGKTSFVNAVVSRIRLDLTRPDRRCAVLHVYLPLARPLAPVELMQHVLWGLYDQMSATHLMRRLDPSLRGRLELAYLRTTINIARHTSDQRESSIELAGINRLFGLASAMTPLKVNAKRTRSTASDFAYANYDEKAIEHDIISITRELTHGDWTRSSRLSRAFGTRQPHPPLKIIITFDELDKLEGEETPVNGEGCLDTLLRTLKTLLTTSGITFLFVGGKDLYERWHSDLERGDSVYESVFSHAVYLPALWLETGAMAGHVLDTTAVQIGQAVTDRSAYGDFIGFLEFMGRGIPRRILRTFQSYITSGSDGAFLRFTAGDARQFRFYADLQRYLRNSRTELLGESAAEIDPERRDRQQLGIYYLVDWALSRGGRSFTFDDAVAGSAALSRQVAMADDVAPVVVKRLLDGLVAARILEVEENHALSAPIVNGAVLQSPTRFRVPRNRLIEMGRYEEVNQQEAAGTIGMSPSQTDARASAPPRMFAGRYEIGPEIGRGGFSTVYRAQDMRTGRPVAIKTLQGLVADDQSVARFRREVDILEKLHHPGVVQYLDGGISESMPFLVMDLVDGVVLADLVDSGSPLPWSVVVRIARELLQTLAYLHSLGVLWRDAKPANVVLTEDGRVVILDFGVSLIVGGTRSDTGIVGTPAYIAPEVFSGQPYDQRADIYSVGILLFELVTGRLPFGSADSGESMFQMMFRAANEPVPSVRDFVDVPAALDEMIRNATERLPDRRLASATAGTNLLASLDGNVDLAKLARDAQARRLERQYEEVRQTLQGGVLPPLPDLRVRVPAAVTVDVSPTIGRGDEKTDAIVFVGLRGTTLVARSLKQPITRVGRSRDNDIVIADGAASRYHLEFRQLGVSWWVFELNSANGALFNAERLDSSRELSNGDQIWIGESVLEFHDR